MFRNRPRPGPQPGGPRRLSGRSSSSSSRWCCPGLTPAWAQGSESCPGGGTAPTPTDIAVDIVPIVVTSTTDAYFVLYVKHDLTGTILRDRLLPDMVELPVLVALGEAGTTTLGREPGGAAP